MWFWCLIDRTVPPFSSVHPFSQRQPALIKGMTKPSLSPPIQVLKRIWAKWNHCKHHHHFNHLKSVMKAKVTKTPNSNASRLSTGLWLNGSFPFHLFCYVLYPWGKKINLSYNLLFFTLSVKQSVNLYIAKLVKSPYVAVVQLRFSDAVSSPMSQKTSLTALLQCVCK